MWSRLPVSSAAGQEPVDLGQEVFTGGIAFRQQVVAVVDDGSTREAGELNGYSIVEANDRDAALTLVVGHPFLSDKAGNFSVDVYELLPVPM